MIKKIIKANIQIIFLFNTMTLNCYELSSIENKENLFDTKQIVIHQPMEKDDFESTIQNIYFENSKIEEIDIQGAPLLAPTQSDFYFLRYLPYATSLKSLTLKSCGLTSTDADHIWEVLRYDFDFSLEKLDLSHNPLAVFGESFGPAIQETDTLRELYLNDAGLKDWRINNVAAAFTVNTITKVLSLQSNGIDDLGALQLGKMVTLNRSLEKLDLSNNNITKSGLEELIFGLRGNTKLKEINLKDNPISKNDLDSLDISLKNSVFKF